MKLRLSHSNSIIHWEDAWCYLGNNYYTRKKFEKTLTGENISLSAIIKDEEKNNRPHILHWIKCQREANKDSLLWWMSQLAGRNNMVSKLFINLVQIAALQKWIIKYRGETSELLVICDDIFMMLAIRDNLNNYVTINLYPGWIKSYINEHYIYLTKGIKMVFQTILRLFRHAYYAKKSRPEVNNLPNGDIHIIHQCLDDKSLMNSGLISSRYFTSLPAWLEKQDRKVFSLPWLNNVSTPLCTVYKKLRRSNYIIPHDWLTLADYFSAIGQSLGSCFAIKKRISRCGKLNLKKLIERERLIQFMKGTSFSDFWIYRPALVRFTRNSSKIMIYSHFEMMPPQHVQTFTINSLTRKKTTTVGYCHCVVSQDFLGYHFPEEEEKSTVFPNYVVTNGQLSTSILTKQGFPPERLITGPALRNNFPNNNNNKMIPNKRNAILLPLPLIYNASIEMIDILLSLRGWIAKRLSATVLLKPHPMSNKSRIGLILDKLGLEKLPENWIIFYGEIDEAVFLSRCAISFNSASIVDIVIGGCIPINLSRFNDLNWNYLDHLEQQFDILKPIKVSQLKERLRNIYIRERIYYNATISKLNTLLSKGINPVSDHSMKVFL
tara:strand:+ start:351 stop:2171 length:1821 start_codon:yes stop_codon:yes gene_type:complete